MVVTSYPIRIGSEGEPEILSDPWTRPDLVDTHLLVILRGERRFWSYPGFVDGAVRSVR